MRSAGLSKTIRIKDEAARVEAMRTFKDEMVDYVFDAPLSMWTRHTRRAVAYQLKDLGKDAVRPYLPRFFEPLGDPRGGALDGSIEILAWFGEEVVDKLEALADGGDKRIRVNALRALATYAAKSDTKEDHVARIVRRLETAAASDDIDVVRAARDGLKQIAAEKDKRD
jgi:hypothetical protein